MQEFVLLSYTCNQAIAVPTTYVKKGNLAVSLFQLFELNPFND